MPRRFVHRSLVAMRDVGLVQAVLRRHALRHLDRLVSNHVTVIITSWNSERFLEVCLRAVRHFADRPLTIRVIDNHSKESPRHIAEAAGASFVRLPANLGHSMALDIGFLTSRSEWTVTLDVDAFPYGGEWLSTLLAPLDDGATVAGAEWREYAHPCALAMRTEHFVRAGHTFAADPRRGWDVGEGISRLEGPERVALLRKTGNLFGDEIVGATYEGRIYHNAYSTRHLRTEDPDATVLDGFMTRTDAFSVWEEALRRFGPDTWE